MPENVNVKARTDDLNNWRELGLIKEQLRKRRTGARSLRSKRAFLHFPRPIRHALQSGRRPAMASAESASVEKTHPRRTTPRSPSQPIEEKKETVKPGPSKAN